MAACASSGRSSAGPGVAAGQERRGSLKLSGVTQRVWLCRPTLSDLCCSIPHPTSSTDFRTRRCLRALTRRINRIEVWETRQLGRLFTLDGPMTSTGDEFIYHECMVHPAALAHPAPRAALVLGGGDGGAARQLLAHPGIERIVVAELDEQVVRLTREYLRRTCTAAPSTMRAQRSNW